MYKIEKKLYGYKLTFGDFIKDEEMKQWVEEASKVLESAPYEFGVFVDMRGLKPLAVGAQQLMKEGQKLFKKKGMQRSVVILDSPGITLQFKRLGRESGIHDFERYIDASSMANWEEVGLKWIKYSIDPDKPEDKPQDRNSR